MHCLGLFRHSWSPKPGSGLDRSRQPHLKKENGKVPPTYPKGSLDCSQERRNWGIKTGTLETSDGARLLRTLAVFKPFQTHPLILLPVCFSFQSCDMSSRLNLHLLVMPCRATPRQHRFAACKKLNVALARLSQQTRPTYIVDVDELKFHCWNVVWLRCTLLYCCTITIGLHWIIWMSSSSYWIMNQTWAIPTIFVGFWPSPSLIRCD